MVVGTPAVLPVALPATSSSRECFALVDSVLSKPALRALLIADTSSLSADASRLKGDLKATHASWT